MSLKSKKLIQFFSQDFAVAEHLSGKPGQYFTLEETLTGIEAILSGKEAPAQQTQPDKKSESKKSDDKKAPATS